MASDTHWESTRVPGCYKAPFSTSLASAQTLAVQHMPCTAAPGFTCLQQCCAVPLVLHAACAACRCL